MPVPTETSAADLPVLPRPVHSKVPSKPPVRPDADSCVRFNPRRSKEVTVQLLNLPDFRSLKRHPLIFFYSELSSEQSARASVPQVVSNSTALKP